MPQRFGDFATWTGAIGTVAAFGVAFHGLHKERRHRLAREMKDRVLAKREHADHVSAWISDGELVVANKSGHPIHDFEVSYTSNSEDKDATAATSLAFLVPGNTALPMPARIASQIPTLIFTDSRGYRWIREPGKPPTLQTES